ncbi:indolepyruvate decarboxylase, partial [Bacillus sp. MB366]|uniref:thiamine pyrophosphate-dependent enzyme n=1 Tax=Bacillus sp. MB366 TaxID=1663555 RepID=UPI000952F375
EQMCRLLHEHAVLILEQRSPCFGMAAIPLPNTTASVGQPVWGAIVYTLPALLGTQLANLSRRNILIIGDGSFQVTAQELSTILRKNLKPIKFLINNNGYTVERAINGQDQLYHHIQMWDYNKLSMVAGAAEKRLTFTVEKDAAY